MTYIVKCPTCNSETTVKTVQKGTDVGRKFYVCSRFPKCPGRLDYMIQSKIIELDKLRELYEHTTQIEKTEFERYKAEQEQTIQNERLEVRKYKALQEQMIENERARQEQLVKQEKNWLKGQELQLKQEKDRLTADIERDKAAFDQLVKEKTQAFPWLAAAYADHFYLKGLKGADSLEYKSHPARKAAEEVRQMAKECREAEQAARISNYLLQYCKFLAPWLDDYIGIEAEELDAIIHEIHSSWEKKEKELDEEVKRQTGPRIWEALTPTERLQRKLDWYWNRPDKKNWQLGRDYENYIGHLYELKGWDVYFHGSKGFEDLGRDLICKKDGCVEIVQCKNWSQLKTIHEKNIYYLFGTTVEYCIEKFGKLEDLQLSLIPTHIQKREITPKLVTTTGVSSKAEQVAEALQVVIERIPFQRYPSVKCNVSRRTGEKIYHLPFDQQYETILIEEDKLECYVETVAEAESLGFRHAFKWTGE